MEREKDRMARRHLENWDQCIEALCMMMDEFGIARLLSRDGKIALMIESDEAAAELMMRSSW